VRCPFWPTSDCLALSANADLSCSTRQELGTKSLWVSSLRGAKRDADRALHAEAVFQPALEACRLILSYTRYALYTPTHVDARTNASDLRGPAGGGDIDF
jgi:hypothetical protein